MRLSRRSVAALLMSAALLLPVAAVHGQAVGRVPTMTRLVAQFMDLELRMLDAQRAGDSPTLQALLGEDFELRAAREPGSPVPRAEWLKTQAGQSGAAGAIEQMAVHNLGSAVNVSYLLRPEGTGPARFVVDTWVRNGDAWHLKVRYAAPVVIDVGKPGKVQAQPKL